LEREFAEGIDMISGVPLDPSQASSPLSLVQEFRSTGGVGKNRQYPYYKEGERQKRRGRDVREMEKKSRLPSSQSEKKGGKTLQRRKGCGQK